MARNHKLKGHSQMLDVQRRVMLNNSLALDIVPGSARLVVGSIDDREDESVAFRNPAVVSAMDILAQVMEELGQPRVEPDSDAPVMIRPKRQLSWIQCPTCDGEGGTEDAFGNYFECDTCAGAGLIRLE